MTVQVTARTVETVKGPKQAWVVEPTETIVVDRARLTRFRSEGHTGSDVDRVAFTRLLFENLEEQLDAHAAGGFPALRPRFERLFRMQGEPVGVEEIGGERIDGVARGIAPDGALEIEIGEGPRSGEVARVMAGDVTLAKSTRDAR